MSDQNAQAEDVAASAMPINILAQYIRDVSFENPMAPDSLREGLENPEMDIQIGMDARKIFDKNLDHLYEVVVNLRAAARRNEDEPLFILELQYGVAVALNGIPEDDHHALLLIEIPRLAFPYVRQIASDLTAQGGYPPLMLNPVDFKALYMERFKDEIEQAERDLKEEEQQKASEKKPSQKTAKSEKK